MGHNEKQQEEQENNKRTKAPESAQHHLKTT